MSTTNRERREPRAREAAPAQRVMDFLRKSRAQGFGGRSLETIAYAARFTDRDQLREVLARLVDSGRLVHEPGVPREGSYEPTADKWRVS